MSAPSFPSPSFQPRRNLSQNAQLPLPSTLSAQSPTRSQFCSSAPSGNTSRPNSPHRSTPTTPQRPRGMSVLTNRTLGANFSPSSPNATPSPHNRSTHAGGIQPSAPFFRPSRPDYQENYSRPSSFASSDDVTAEHVLEVDVYPLSRLSPAASPTRTHTATGENEGGALVEEHIGVVKLDDQEEALHEENVQGGAEYGRSIRKTKQSKEPLLPISGRPGGLGTRGSLSKRDQTLMGLGVSVPDGAQDRGNRLSGGSLMKTGIDRVFSIGRGLSLESIRRSIGGDEVAAKEIGGRRTPMNGTANHIAYIHRTSTSPSRSRYKYTSGHFPGAAKRHSHSLSVSRHTPISPSPDPSFVSQPPENLPHLNSVPMKDPKTGRVVRRYERHPSRNRFFLRGHLLTGGDSPWAFIICLSIVLGLSGVWFATTCVWWWHNESPAVAIVGAYMALIVISSMLTTAFTDPGILPRDLDLNPPYNADGENATPLPRDLRVRNDTVRVKYCTTCKTYRPPRASHCKMVNHSLVPLIDDDIDSNSVIIAWTDVTITVNG
ncbi:hypothetical protein APHAL10511_000943 [Amanita phalloides]|nr:hypothetical protein APHAL10511_000943 [Amanita phalloides]